MSDKPLETRGAVIAGPDAFSYDQKQSTVQRVKQVHITFVHLKPGQRLLDVGCGTGATLAVLQATYGDGVELYGVEPSDDMLSQARDKLAASNTQLKLATAENLPFKDAYFDYVTSSLVMHHLPMDLKRRAIQEMWRVLKPKGTLVISDYEKPTTLLGWCRAWKLRKHAFTAENTKGPLVELLQEAGFTKIDDGPAQMGVVHHFVAKK